jgi:hypothetical protein
MQKTLGENLKEHNVGDAELINIQKFLWTAGLG